MVNEQVNHLIPPQIATLKHAMKLLVLTLAFSFFASQTFATTTLKVSVDRNPAMAGETFFLTAVADDSVNNNALDTKPLLKDFIVGQTNTQILNGSMTQQTTWRVALIARTPGQYTIPALSADGVSSQPISMNIVERTQASEENQEVKLETDISTKTTYIGQPIIYTIKLFIGTRLQRANLQAPSLIGGDVVQMNEDEDASEIIDGKRYRTITRRYSITPSQAGTFDLQGTIFRGDISQYGYGRSKPISLVGDNEQIIVKPIPNDFPGQWLASPIVTLEDEWPSADVYKVGEPITRTLTLSAANVSTEQMPEINIDTGINLQAYPDKPLFKKGFSGNTLISQVVQKLAIIPSKAGSITIPEVRIPWFNVNTESVEWATIASKTIEVTDNAPLPSATPIQPTPVAVSKPLPIAPQQTTITTPPSYLWLIVSAILFILLTIALFYIVRLRQQVIKQPLRQSKSLEIKSVSYVTLITALDNNDLTKVMKLLPLWLKNDFNKTLSDRAVITANIAEYYQQLAQNTYSQQPQKCDTKALKQCVVAFMKNNKVTAKPSLDGLYKN
ncbi:BatD family protein [Psychrobium sp. nBUS_13]|uniref:BatD family protein n=1 Tax=Psychrobium sp. nBUS_13 TaxID=3395319 RepID=UPI003EB8E4EC